MKSLRNHGTGPVPSDYYLDRYARRYGLDYLELADIALRVAGALMEK